LFERNGTIYYILGKTFYKAGTGYSKEKLEQKIPDAEFNGVKLFLFEKRFP